MGLSDGRKSFPIGLAVLIQYRSVTATQPPRHVSVAITLNAKGTSLKTALTHCVARIYLACFAQKLSVIISGKQKGKGTWHVLMEVYIFGD